MADWADQEANELAGICGVQGDAWRIAEALRQARLDALEEAGAALDAEDERHAAIIVRSLKEKQP